MPRVPLDEAVRIMQTEKKKRKRFDFAKTKALATSPLRAVRKQAFIEYYEDFAEFPSFFFDNERGIDPVLYETVQDLIKDPETPKAMRKALDELLMRLPS